MKKFIVLILILLTTPSYAGVNNITEADGSPSIYPWKLKFSNGTVTDNGDGTASIAGGSVDIGSSIASGTTGSVLYINTGPVLAQTAVGSTGQVLRSAGAATPTWSTMTRLNTSTAARMFYSSGSNAEQQTGTNLTYSSVTGIATTAGTIDGTTIGASTAADATFNSIKFSQTIQGTNTGNVGWSVVTGANTACTTTCTSAAVVGFDQGTLGAVLPSIVGPADATADQCLCAGPS